MNFKLWLEQHIDDLYPDKGDFVIVKSVLYGTHMKKIPPGTYLCIDKNDNVELYTLQHTISKEMHRIYYSDFDTAMEADKVKLD